MEVVLPRAKYPEPTQRAQFFTRVLEILESNPQVIAVGGATNLPLSNTNMTFGFYRDGMVPGKEAPFTANVRGVTSGYFRALGIPLIRGRGLLPTDREGSAPVVVINEAMRRKFWRDQDPIGERISITRGRTIIWREIVGIVGDVRHAGLGVDPDPEIYMPYAHDPFMFLRVAVRSHAEPEALAGAMRAAVWAVDPGSAREPCPADVRRRVVVACRRAVQHDHDRQLCAAGADPRGCRPLRRHRLQRHAPAPRVRRPPRARRRSPAHPRPRAPPGPDAVWYRSRARSGTRPTS